MKRITNPTIQQEVVLATNSRFARQQYFEQNNNKDKSQSQEDHLANACWNGMLKEMLPELFVKSDSAAHLFLWQMRTCKNTLTLEMAEEPREMDFSASIDPYCFMELQVYN